MILGSGRIQEAMRERQILISPFSKRQLQSCSYDLRLGSLIYVREGTGYVLKDIGTISFMLQPGQFILTHTYEFVGSDRYAGSMGTTSTASRHGLDIHGSSAFIEPGFFNRITLEITNRSDKMIRLMPFTCVATIRFEEIAGLESTYSDTYKLAVDSMQTHQEIDYESLWKPEMMMPKKLIILKPGEENLQEVDEIGSSSVAA